MSQCALDRQAARTCIHSVTDRDVWQDSQSACKTAFKARLRECGQALYVAITTDVRLDM